MNSTALQQMGMEDYEGLDVHINPPKNSPANKKVNSVPIETGIDSFIKNNPALQAKMRKYLITFGQNPASDYTVMAQQIYETRKKIHHNWKKRARKNHINKESWDNYIMSPMASYDFDAFEAEVERQKGFEGFDDYDEQFETFLPMLGGIAAKLGGKLFSGAKNLISKIGHKGAKASDEESTKHHQDALADSHAALAAAMSGAQKAGADPAMLNSALSKHSKKMAKYINAVNTSNIKEIKDAAAKNALAIQQSKIDTVNAVADTLKDNNIASQKFDMQKNMPFVIIAIIVLIAGAFFMGKKS